MTLLQILIQVIIGAIGGWLFALVLKAIFKKSSIHFAAKIKLIKHILFKTENVIYIEISDRNMYSFLKDKSYEFNVMTNLHRYCEMQIIKDIANSFNNTDVILEKALFEAEIDEKNKEVIND